MTPQQRLAERMVSFDTETDLIQPGIQAPPLACASWATRNIPDGVFSTAEQARGFFAALVADDSVVVGANIAYDFAVMVQDAVARGRRDLVGGTFGKYARGEVYDVQVAQALDAIAGGHLFKNPNGHDLYSPKTGRKVNRYSLDLCVRLVLGRDDAKALDFWRTRYAVLRAALPPERWPAEAVQYPRDDARNTLEVALAQVLGRVEVKGPDGLPRLELGDGSGGFRNLHCMPQQVRAAFALHLFCCWSFRTDGERVADLKRRTLEDRAATAPRWYALGFVEEGGGKEGRDKKEAPVLKRRMAAAYGARAACPHCAGAGKTRAGKRGALVGCTTKNLLAARDSDTHARHFEADPEGCDGTGLVLAGAPMLSRTDKGAVQTGRDFLAESGDEDLMEFAEWCEDDKLVTSYIPFLESGTEHPVPMRANVLVESNRASYDGVVMTLPRDGEVRSCVRAREGYVFCSTDYESGELCTLAQVCLWVVGRSRMAEVINATKDPGMLHTRFAARLLGVTPEEAKARVKAGDPTATKYRQAAKPFNFGLPGGMGAAKLVLSKRKKSEGTTTAPDGRVYNGIRFCLLIGNAQRCGERVVTEWRGRPCQPVCLRCVECAADAKSEWMAEWDEMGPYFDWVSSQVDAVGAIVSLGSKMVRGGLGFCDGANHGFQHLLACGAKDALWDVCREMYVGRAEGADEDSPLYGSRGCLFMHDEMFSEVPDLSPAHRHAAAHRQAELMVGGLKRYCPDVHVACEPALMRRWYKGAKRVVGEDGFLAPWEPPSATVVAA